jgi:purine-cytosine permease-like protein
MMECDLCFGWGEIIVAGWLGVLFGVAIMALLQMAGDRSGVRERDEEGP